MSFNKIVQNSMDKAITDFIHKIANKYNINSSELLPEWYGKNIEIVESTSSSQNQETEGCTTREDLLKMKKPEIQALCKKNELKYSGTKTELIDILLGCANGKSKKAPIKKTTEIKPTPKPTPIETLIANQSSTIAIRRNQFGNHEHPETGLIFDKKTKKVIGKQNDDGSIEDLTVAYIDLCNKHKFGYVLPDDLEQKTSLDDIDVEELEEDEILESEDEQFEEDDIMEEFEEEFEDLEEEFEDT